MAYQYLNLPSTLHPSIQQIIRNQLEPLLSEVHTMLRLPIDTEDGLNAGCNLSAASTLLAIVSGVSVTVHDPSALSDRGNRGLKFKELLNDYYPWDQERHIANGIYDNQAAEILYGFFRNPLAHALGIFDPNSNPTGTHIVVEKGPIPENLLISLENCSTRPSDWSNPTLRKNRNEITLWVRSFYWGVRNMIENLANCTYVSTRILSGGQTETRST